MEMQTVLVSVKSGHVNSAMVRDLKGTVEREKAAIGLFVTLEESKLLEEGRRAQLPPFVQPGYQQAERIPTKKAGEQRELFG
jgi:hypothetical protein